MKFQLFGNRNVRTSEELKSVGQRKNTLRKMDDWRIDSVSALQVPILSSKKASASEASSQANEALSPAVNDHLTLVDSTLSLPKKVGIYSYSQAYCSDLCDKLNASGLDVFSFSSDKNSSEFSIKDANLMDIWLIHMTDEDESTCLESVLELGANVSSLFLFEQSLTDQCLKKVQGFMLETKRAC